MVGVGIGIGGLVIERSERMGEILCSCLNQSIVIMFVKFFWGRELGWDAVQCNRELLPAGMNENCHDRFIMPSTNTAICTMLVSG